MAIIGGLQNTNNVVPVPDYNNNNGGTVGGSTKVSNNVGSGVVNGGAPTTVPDTGSGSTTHDITYSGAVLVSLYDTLLQTSAALKTVQKQLGEISPSDLWNKPSGAIDELARIIVMFAAAVSREALQTSRNQADASIAQLLAQSASLRAQADSIMAGAIAALVMSVVSSVVQIAGAAAQLKTLGTAQKEAAAAKNATQQPGMRDGQIGEPSSGKPNPTSDGKEPLFDPQTIMQTANTKAGAQNMMTQGISGLFQAFGNFINSMFQAQGKLEEAKASEQAAESQHNNSYSQEAQKIAEDLGKLVDQIINLVKEIIDQEVQMMQATTKV